MTNREYAFEKYCVLLSEAIQNNEGTFTIGTYLSDLLDSKDLYLKVLEKECQYREYPDLQERLDSLIGRDMTITLQNQLDFFNRIEIDLQEIYKKYNMDLLYFYLKKEGYL